MRNWIAILLFLVAPAFWATALVSCGGCVTNPAEEKVLLPAMRLSWTGVKENIETGIGAQQDGAGNLQGLVLQLDAAIGTGDLEAIGVFPWEVLEPVGQAGITEMVRTQRITEGVAVSLRERLKNFTDAINEIRS